MTSPGTESASAAIAVPAVLVAAVDEARAAVVEFSGADTVGEHLGVDYEDATAATHRFGAVLPGYQGWQWAVVVAAFPGAAHSTVSEVVLVPGPGALLSPEWVPWDQRVRPGDLGPGDLLAPPADDPRLVPGYTSSGDPDLDEVAASSAWAALAVEPAGSRRGGATLARRRLRAGFGDGAVHQAGLPRLRLLSAAGRCSRHRVRGLLQ